MLLAGDVNGDSFTDIISLATTAFPTPEVVESLVNDGGDPPFLFNADTYGPGPPAPFNVIAMGRLR